ncbi:MAG: penicillin acylase family protein [Candidatus Poribacteria bacterium]|nr:penicillin acylase family protein [Candidatus Poribacteria bacterium]
MDAKITENDLRSCLPDLTTTMRLPELGAAVDVYRDQWGIPHIRAESEADLFFAQGFVTAQDRLWHMDFDRHQALGRWSEYAGSGGVERDRLLRAAGMGRTAKLDYKLASPAAKSMVDAFTAGVNAFLDTTRTLPIEYKLLDARPERWENWHCLAVYKMRNTLLGTFEPKLFLTRLAIAIGGERAANVIKGYPAGHLITVPPGAVYEGPPPDGLEELTKAAEEVNWLNESDFGSNAWSISGERTASGLPLVAGDSHRALDTPSVYYQIHLSCPEFSVIGHSVPGMPGALHFCHNEHVAWGMTYGSADTQDLFIEKFRETPHGREYLFKGEWREAEVLNETIEVRGGESVEHQVTITHHGPVIAGDPAAGVGVAISDPGLIDGSRWVDAALDAMKSRSVAELHEAFRHWTDRVNNYAVADVDGNYGYIHAGKIPIRGEANGWRAVPGWTGEYEWDGYIPHDELPKAINPETGYAVTCNQRVAGDDYPYYVGICFTPEHRARRVRAGILGLEAGSAAVDDMARIHADSISAPAKIFTRALIEIEPRDADSEAALALMREWDYNIDRDGVQPLIYAKTRAHVVRRIVEHLLGDFASEVLSEAAGSGTVLRQIVEQMTLGLERNDASMLPPDTGWEELLAASLSCAVRELWESLGEDMSQWRWGRLHRTEPRHPLSEVFPEAAEHLDPPSVETHGDGDTPLAGGYGLQQEFVPTGISVNRYIHDPSDWTKSRWIVPLGASGHPGSPHYADQAEAWANVEYIPQLWDWDEIRRAAESHQRFEPRNSGQ